MKDILALSDMHLQIYLDHVVVPSQHIPETQNAFHFEMLGSEILIQPLQVDDWAPPLSFLGTTNKGLKKASFFSQLAPLPPCATDPALPRPEQLSAPLN